MTLECVADFTSIVMCDDDWSPNYVEHVKRAHRIKDIVSVNDAPNIHGYLRIENKKNKMLIVAGDWGELV